MPKPKPLYWFKLWFIEERKKYHLKLKVFANSLDLSEYYRQERQHKKLKRILGAVLWHGYSSKKRYLGEMIFSADHLYSNIIAHESFHMGFRYFRAVKNTSTFSNKDREEQLVTLSDRISNLVHRTLQRKKARLCLVMPKR